MTCVHCGKRKGKRTCPALHGAICPACCGQHRLREIECPADCVHLGGLAVVRDPARADAAFSSADYNAMFALLEHYAHGMAELGRAALRRLYAGPERPADWEAPTAMGYLYYGYRDSQGRRMIDHFLAARGRDLRPAEVAAALALQRAWASLFEITAVHAGVGLTLRDLRSGETITIREVSATSQLKKRDVLFTWILPFPDHLELTGSACVVPRPHLDQVRAALDAELERARRAHPGVPDRELVGAAAWIVITTLRAAFRDVPSGRAARSDEVPLETRREVARQYLRDYYQRWIDMPVPALGGATPRDAARSPALRAQIEAMLADLEHDAARMDGGDAIDFAAMRHELGLPGAADPDEPLRYDAAQRPDAARWLALDDHVKTRAVEAHHRELAAHPATPDPRMHAMMHVIAENQLAEGNPPEARAALERLMGAGLARHAAIHAVGSAVAGAIWKALREQVSFDRQANARALDRLRPEGWSF